MFEVTGIRLNNVRSIDGEQFFPIARGLTVLMGRNNAGKSTVLRSPFLFRSNSAPLHTYLRTGAASFSVAFQIEIARDEFEKIAGFSQSRIGDISAPLGGQKIRIATTAEFSPWETRPLAEFGWRFTTKTGNITETVRLVSRARGPHAYVEIFNSNTEPPEGQLRTVELAQIEARSEWFTGGFGFFGRAPDFLAHWEHDRPKYVSDWIQQHTRRVIDTKEERLQESLTFLKMKHSLEFDRISAALSRALPEFEKLDFQDESNQGFGYRPAFVARGNTKASLTREAIGSGAWTFLCILTAARAAKATGASVLMLDEPHLYLHPGLERLLIDELVDPAKWDGKPLHVVAATHSPTFVDAAVEAGALNILDWKDDKRTSAIVRAVSREDATSIFGKLTSQPSDLLYADRLVFVEGPSDVAALRVLARERCGVKRSLRFIPLRESDAVASEVSRYFSVVLQAHGLGFLTRGLIVLDADKRNALVPKWNKLGELDPGAMANQGLRVVWAGLHGNDIESSFCDSRFLTAYFQSRGIPSSTSTTEVDAALAKIVSPAKKKDEKGCEAIRLLHEKLIGAPEATKADYLDALMNFYVQNAQLGICDEPRARLAELEKALAEVGEATR